LRGTKQAIWLAVAALVGIGAYFLPLDLSQAGRITLGIFFVATVLWVTEAVPLFVTSFVIVLLEVTLLGLPGGPLKFAAGEYKVFLSPFFDNVIALFLGGFALGAALNRYALDEVIAMQILRRFGRSPGAVQAGFMLATALMSMWMSNTATAALMMVVALPVLRRLSDSDPFRKSLVLAIPFAANIGGMGTPIGTPPNAIAVGALARLGISVSFIRWMMMGLPLVVILLAVTWWLLRTFFPPQANEVRIEFGARRDFGREAKVVVTVFLVTVALWLTAQWHGVPEGIIGLLPVVLFFGLRVLEQDDIRGMGWDTLLLVGGGLSLGVAMKASGLSAWAVEQVNLTGLSSIVVLLILGGMAALMTTFISNSATAGLLIPIVVGLGGDMLLVITAAVAFAASASMALPVSTPPNAIAFASGEVRSSDMFKAGAIITVLAVLVISLAGILLWPLIGIS